MAGVESLKAGQGVALKPADDNVPAAVHGEIVSIQKGRIRIRVSEAGRKSVDGYKERRQCTLVWDDRGHGLQASVTVQGREGGDLVVVAQNQGDKREAHRSMTRAVFSYEVLSPERVAEAAQEIRTATSDFVDDTVSVDRFWHSTDDTWEKLDEEFSRLSHQMAELNSKLDHLIALGEGRAPDHAVRRHREMEDFSGTGLCFFENKPIPEKSVLRITIELSRFPRQVVHCLGEVVRCDAQAEPGAAAPDSFCIGLHFTVINEDDRERIIRHIFRMQRRMLRNRKERATED